MKTLIFILLLVGFASNFNISKAEKVNIFDTKQLIEIDTTIYKIVVIDNRYYLIDKNSNDKVNNSIKEKTEELKFSFSDVILIIIGLVCILILIMLFILDN